jgi:hypothetical protein
MTEPAMAPPNRASKGYGTPALPKEHEPKVKRTIKRIQKLFSAIKPYYRQINQQVNKPFRKLKLQKTR